MMVFDDGRRARGIEKKRKKVFLSLFSLAAGGSCFLPLSIFLVPGVVLSFFLIRPDLWVLGS